MRSQQGEWRGDSESSGFPPRFPAHTTKISPLSCDTYQRLVLKPSRLFHNKLNSGEKCWRWFMFTEMGTRGSEEILFTCFSAQCQREASKDWM